jgi:ABC-type multidrug transport system fused ATPase/permease subunit
MKIVKDVWEILDSRSKLTIAILQFFLIGSSLLETLSIIILAPFMGLISGELKVEESKFLNYFFELSNINYDQFIFYFGIFVLIFFLISNLINIITIYFINFFSERIGAKISTRLYNIYIHKPYEFHLEISSSEIVNKIVYDADRLYSIIKRILQSNSDIFKCIFIIIALIIYNFKVAILLTLIFSSIYIIIYIFLEKILIRNGKILSENNSIIFKLIQEGLGAIKDIIILKKYNFFSKSFFRYRFRVSNLTAFNQTSAIIPRNIIEMVAFSIIISSILMSIKGNFFINSSLSMLAVFGLASYKLLPNFQNIYFNLSTIKSFQESFYKISDDLKETNNTTVYNNHYKKLTLKKNLELKNINWKYKKSKKILDNVNIIINPNEIVGIVGKSGAGKSTLGNIILGLLQPKEGIFKVDGIDINESNIENWQNNISFVPQNIFLIEGNLKDNIVFGEEPDLFSEEKFKNAIKIAELDDFITQSINGIKTTVGEKGISLSGGQSQRVGIARALYNDRDILFFDEATSSLDGLTETNIINSIKKLKNKTLFIISHNFSTIKNCDKIIFLEDGKVQDIGNYTELIKNNKKFARLAEVS